jgi:lactoylglutathione lyase/glyoxylase I family protein
MIKQLAHVCIGAIDLAASEHFYCDVLGLTKKFRFIRGGKEFGFYLDAGNNNYIEVFAQDAPSDNERPIIKHFCLQVDDIDEAIRSISAAEVAVTEKQLGSDQSWQAWITDPSGVRIELHQYTDESTQLTGQDCIISQ